MNGVVSNLYDIDSIVIPEELLKTSVDEQRVENEVQALSVRYAKEVVADDVSKGDLVYCQADKASYPDGRTILIYTGMDIPGAEKAAATVVGKKVNDTFASVLLDKQVTLTVKKIIHRIPVAVNDTLIANMGIEGVTSVENYKAYIRAKIMEDQKLENSKAIIHYIMDQMVEHSAYIYDEKEMEAHVNNMMAQYAQYEAEMPEDDIEESPEDIKESIIYQAKQYWMAKAFCEQKGITIDENDVEAEMNRMIEMMELTGEPIPERKEMKAMMIQDAYLNAFFEYIDRMIEQKAGDADGSR